jgi:hypothetical protein
MSNDGSLSQLNFLREFEKSNQKKYEHNPIQELSLNNNGHDRNANHGYEKT